MAEKKEERRKSDRVPVGRLHAIHSFIAFTTGSQTVHRDSLSFLGIDSCHALVPF